jgi:hypothetical protein
MAMPNNAQRICFIEANKNFRSGNQFFQHAFVCSRLKRKA